jgi:hypothetical protein
MKRTLIFAVLLLTALPGFRSRQKDRHRQFEPRHQFDHAISHDHLLRMKPQGARGYKIKTAKNLPASV